MPDLADGQSALVQGSGRTPYTLKNVGGVYSCSCPAWRNQSLPIERQWRDGNIRASAAVWEVIPVEVPWPGARRLRVGFVSVRAIRRTRILH